MKLSRNLPWTVLLILLVRVLSLTRWSMGSNSDIIPNSSVDADHLWAGLDVDLLTPGLPQGNALLSTEVAVELRRPRVHILGLQDTGTNLMFSLLWRNFRQQLTFYDSTFRDSANLRRSEVWKHANVHELSACHSGELERLRRDGVTAIVMVRNPLSWLQSIRKAPYAFESCAVREDWLSHPCLHHFPAGFAKCNGTRHIAAPIEYSHLGQVWGKWNSAYSFLKRYGFADVMVVRYEDVVSDPDAFLRDIGFRLNLTMPARGFQEVAEAAKTHGQALGRGEALFKINQKTYLSDFKPGDLVDACRSLERFSKLAHLYGYSDCDGTLSGITKLSP